MIVLLLEIMDTTLGFLAPVIIIAVIFILNVLLPGRWVNGYITKPNSLEKMRYHLNGISVLFVVVIAWFLLGYFEILSFDWLYIHRWQGLASACAIGIIFSIAIVISYPPVRKFFLADLFFGRVENFQLWGGKVDAKMCLYLIGAVILELNVLSFAAHHWLLFGPLASPGIYLSAALITYFVIDYLTFEEVHLYTYDLFAERVGFKLGWGCIIFYPYFYSISLWTTVQLPNPQTPGWLLSIYVIIFFTGWMLARGANMQKYYFKKYPERPFLGIKPQILTDGNKTILVNGFWGASRHINYLGEILMASGIILCTGYPSLIWPWLYPLYYVVLLFTRQNADDKRCALKYGKLWNSYTEKVPYKIIPFVY